MPKKTVPTKDTQPVRFSIDDWQEVRDYSLEVQQRLGLPKPMTIPQSVIYAIRRNREIETVK